MGRAKARKIKRKIRFRQQARIVEKNDATRVSRPEALPRMKARMPADVGPSFRIKIRKKSQ